MKTLTKDVQQFLELAAKQLKETISQYDFSIGEDMSPNMKEACIGIFCEQNMSVEFNGKQELVEPMFVFEGVEQYDIVDGLDTEYYNADHYIQQINNGIVDLVFRPAREDGIFGGFEESIKVNLEDYFTPEQLNEFINVLFSMGV